MPSWVLGALAPQRRFEPPHTRKSWGSAWVMTSQREGMQSGWWRRDRMSVTVLRPTAVVHPTDRPPLSFLLR